MNTKYYLDFLENPKLEWVRKCHRNTNHLYDGKPYEIHLNKALEYGFHFSSLIKENVEETLMGVYGHDLIEDTRVSYNDVKEVLGVFSADIVYACTNEKGKTRKERANDKYYIGLRETSGAVFAKLCDRLSNVYFGQFKRSMLGIYKSEQEDFCRMLGRYTDYKHLEPMFKEIDNLLGI